jgi:hypothetical protein
MKRSMLIAAVVAAAHVLCAPAPVLAGDPGTAFTYQGRLRQNGTPVNGNVNLEFRLFNAAAGGSQISFTIPQNNVAVSDGLFVTQLDFGAAFQGQPLWLQITVNGTPLAPRQQLTPVPYAQTIRGIHVDEAQRVAIGHVTPGAPLDVEGTLRCDKLELSLGDRIIHRATSSMFIPGWDPNTFNAGLTFEATGIGGGDPGGMYFDSHTAAIWNADGSNILQLFNSADLPGGLPRIVFSSGGRMGIGNFNPSWPIDITAPQAVGRFISTTSANGSVIELRNNAANPTFYGAINFVNSAGDTPGQIGYFIPGGGSADHLNFRVGGAPVVGMTAFGMSVVGRTYLQNDAFTVLELNRVVNDGTLITFQRNFGAVGSISVNAGVVSYNAFTGSHYAWTEQTIERGELVRMNGSNRRLNENADGEVVYGVERCTRANDPACLGAYLAPQESGEHLVMAVGNGELWVVDTGRAIEPGDLLIASDVPGCAMLDDAVRFPIGYVVARAAERVDWSEVSADESGARQARISVLFDNFARSRSAEEMSAELAALKSELHMLKRTQDELLDMLRQQERRAR